MTYSQIEDEYRVKLLTATSDNLSDEERVRAVALDVLALSYSNNAGTDGFVTRMAFSTMVFPGFALDMADVDLLLDTGLWTEVPGGYQRQWDHQQTAEEAAERRAAHAADERRRRRHNKGDHSLCSEKCWAVRGEGGEARGEPHGKARGQSRGTSGGQARAASPSHPTSSHKDEEDEMASATPPPSLAKARSDVGLPPNGEPDDEADSEATTNKDWIIPKGEPGYEAQWNRANEWFLKWRALQSEDVRSRLTVAASQKLWVESDPDGDGAARDWHHFKKSELKKMHEAGGRDQWLASQKGR